MTHLKILIFLTFVMACRHRDNFNAKGSFQGGLSKEDSTRIEVVQTVLNMPLVMKFSKIGLIRKKYDSVFFFIESDSFKPSVPVYQDGKAVRQMKSIADVNLDEVPCYVFKKVQIFNDEADVYMLFDITGAIAYGKLQLVDGKWVPGEDFLAGVR